MADCVIDETRADESRIRLLVVRVTLLLGAVLGIYVLLTAFGADAQARSVARGSHGPLGSLVGTVDLAVPVANHAADHVLRAPVTRAVTDTADQATSTAVKAIDSAVGHADASITPVVKHTAVALHTVTNNVVGKAGAVGAVARAASRAAALVDQLSTDVHRVARDVSVGVGRTTDRAAAPTAPVRTAPVHAAQPRPVATTSADPVTPEPTQARTATKHGDRSVVTARLVGTGDAAVSEPVAADGDTPTETVTSRSMPVQGSHGDHGSVPSAPATPAPSTPLTATGGGAGGSTARGPAHDLPNTALPGRGSGVHSLQLMLITRPQDETAPRDRARLVPVAPD